MSNSINIISIYIPVPVFVQSLLGDPLLDPDQRFRTKSKNPSIPIMECLLLLSVSPTSPQINKSQLRLWDGLEEHSQIEKYEQLDQQHELEEVPLRSRFCEIGDSTSEPGKNRSGRKSRLQAHGAIVAVDNGDVEQVGFGLNGYMQPSWLSPNFRYIVWR